MIAKRAALSSRRLSLNHAYRHPVRPGMAALTVTRSLSTTPPVHQQRPPGGPGGHPGGAGGFNIFNQQQQREPGAALKEHGHDLTQLAREGRLDPIIGRDDEIKRTIRVLSRRTKNNPVLVGPAGVGKTAIMEGLAQRIVRKEVPDSLIDKRVVGIDLASVMSGTGVRGSFEQKLRDLLQDIRDEHGKVIVFIDELHTLLNLGKAEGSLDAGNMMKPALAQGMQVAGATTFDEYRQTIEKDAALARRFQPVQVLEPTVGQTITMLRGLKSRYETHHGVAIADSAIVTAAIYSNRYITERFLPDKAIDLIDEAASALRLQQESKPDELESLERQLITLRIELESLKNDQDVATAERRTAINAEIEDLQAEASRLESQWLEERSRLKDIKDTKEQLERAYHDLEQSQRQGNFTKASELRYSTIPSLESKIPKDSDEAARRSSSFLSDRVTADDVVQVVARTTGIPVRNLMRGERQRVMHIAEELSGRVIGQEPAVTAVSEAVRVSRAGLNSESRPIASFLFLGPTGVGKTELAKALTQSLFDTEQALVTINMSEFNEEHSVSRLIGSPPGYVGHEDAGQLTEAVRRKPYAVILLDEFEKAHKNVANVFLRVLDEGALTDSHGRKVDFRNTIIIMTSNLGSDVLMRPEAVDSEGNITPEARSAVLQIVKTAYPPELLNRLDEQIVFNRLTPESQPKIVDYHLGLFEKSLASSTRRLKLDVDENVKKFLAERGYDPAYGARPLRRLIDKSIKVPLSNALHLGTVNDGDTVKFRMNERNDEVVVLENHPPESEQNNSSTEETETKTKGTSSESGSKSESSGDNESKPRELEEL